MYKDDESDDIDDNKESMRMDIAKIDDKDFCLFRPDFVEDFIDESSISAAVSFLIDNYFSKKTFDEEMFGALEHILEYTKTKEATFLTYFCNSNFISVLINAMKQRIPATSTVISILTNIWYLYNDDKEQVLFDEEIIDELTQLFVDAESSDGKYPILKAFVNCVYDNQKVCEIILQNSDFMEQYLHCFVEGDDITLLVYSLKLLFLFIHSGYHEHFIDIFENVTSYLNNSISIVSISATKCFKAFIETNTNYFLNKYNLELINMTLSSLNLGFTDCMIPTFQTLSIILNSNETNQIISYDELRSVFLKEKPVPQIDPEEEDQENKSHNEDEEDSEPILISKYPFLNTIRHTFFRFSQDSADFIYTFLTQSNPFMYKEYFDEGIIEFIFDTIDHTSFRNREPAISYLCDFFMTCDSDEIKSIIGNRLLDVILDNIVFDQINPSLFRWLQVVHDLIVHLSDFDVDHVGQTMDEIISAQEDENDENNQISEIAQQIIDYLLQENGN